MTDEPTPAPPSPAPSDPAPPGFFGRLKSFVGGGDLAPWKTGSTSATPTGGPTTGVVRRGDVVDAGGRTPLLPWNRNGQAIQSLSRGFDELTGLMGDIRDGLRDQRDQQSALLDHLKHLPATLEQLPEANRQTTDALRTLGRQIEGQRESQERLGDVLDKLDRGGAAHRESIDDVQKRLERMRESDAQVAETLGGVGRAIGDVGRTSSESTATLERMREAMDRRDAQFEAALTKQSSRLSGLMTVAVVISLLSLAVAGVLAYLLWTGRVAGV